MTIIQPKRRTIDEQEQYSRLVEIRREISKYQTSPSGIYPSPGLVRYTCALMDTTIGRENRNKLLTESFLRNITSSKDLTAGEQMGLLLWSNPSRDSEGKWHPSPTYLSDMQIIQVYFGQIKMENL